MKKRIVLGIAALAAAAATAAPASAHWEIKYCNPTSPYPCGVCVEEGPIKNC